MKTGSLTLLLAVQLAAAPFAGAQWLTHTPDNSQPSGMATTGVFPTGGLGGYTTTSVQIFSDGTGNGVPGISPNPSGQYNATWLQQFSGSPPAAFDYDNAGGNGIGPNVATFTNFTTAYGLFGDATNQDSAFQGFTTTQALTKMTFIYGVTDPTGGPTIINDSYGIAIRAVPEPSAYLLLGLGLLICGQRFLRRTRTSP